MAQVLVLDPDRDVRAALRTALELEGYHVETVVESSRCLALLSESASPMVVICGNQDPGNHGLTTFFTTVAQDEQLVRRHRYVCLTTTPDAIPSDLHASLVRLGAPVLAKPFALDELLTAVAQAAAMPCAARRGSPFE